MKQKAWKIEIDDVRLSEVCEAYFKWKDVNTYISRVSSRALNMPDAISEPIGCYCLNLLWSRGNQPGDASDSNNKVTEFKATSNFNQDLSSFGPKEEFDNLVFLRFDLSRDKVFIYELGLNSQDLGNYSVNSRETIQDQRQQGRRPRISILNKIIIPNNMQPDMIFDIRKEKII